MIFQHSTELGLRAAVFLAQQAPGKLSPVREIAAEIGVSETYLAKITKRLVSAGLLRSFRGPGNGLELGRSPEKITLLLLVNAIQGSLDSDACFFGLHPCNAEEPCALHAEWMPLRESISAMLEKTTLAGLARSAGWPELLSSAPLELEGRSQTK